MKKFILFLAIALISLITSAQNDSVIFSTEQVLRISNKIIELERKDSLNNILIQELDYQTEQLYDIVKRDSLILVFKNEELMLRKTQIDLYVDLYKTSKPKWHENKFIWFGLGMATVITSSWVVANTTP